MTGFLESCSFLPKPLFLPLHLSFGDCCSQLDKILHAHLLPFFKSYGLTRIMNFLSIETMTSYQALVLMLRMLKSTINTSIN